MRYARLPPALFAAAAFVLAAVLQAAVGPFEVFVALAPVVVAPIVVAPVAGAALVAVAVLICRITHRLHSPVRKTAVRWASTKGASRYATGIARQGGKRQIVASPNR